MSGYYPPGQQFPPSFYNVNPNAVPNPNVQNVAPMMAPDGSLPHMPGAYMPYPPEQHIPQGYIDQYGDVPDPMGAAMGQNPRSRRRTAPGEQVKHRRTRSGCYTCRNRRVKCDETHPICERCRKGSRECVYPEPQAIARPGRSGSKSGPKSSPQEGSSPEDQTGDSKEPLSAIPDEEEEEDDELDDTAPPSEKSPRETSDTPSLIHDRSPSPSTEASSAVTPSMPTRPPISRTSSNQPSKHPVASNRSGLNIPNDVKFFLNYHRNHLSVHNYSLKQDARGFFKRDFLEMAVKHEPLLYAVVGYAAYFYTLSDPNGRISTYLNYYNKSVSLLRQSLLKNKKHSIATLLTILQLASIEEVLGDWVNLMGHQKAAYDILTRLYTPESIMKTELLRKVLLWYIRFDLFVGFQAGSEAVLGREWFVGCHEWYARETREHPEDLTLKYEERFAYSRLVATTGGALFANMKKGTLDNEAFMTQLAELDVRMNSLVKDIDPILLDPSDYVTEADWEGTPSPGPDEIVNWRRPNTIWKGNRWASNYLFLDMWGILFMYKIQVAMFLRKPFEDMSETAYRTAEIYKAVINYPQRPPGAIIEAQATMAIGSIFLPKDPKTVNWCRMTLANVEKAGYIYSNTVRDRMFDSWGVAHSDWWLPNDEGCPPVLRSIKNFIKDRETAPKDQITDDLREMRGIFSTLTITDSPSPDKIGNTPPGARSTLDETLMYTNTSEDIDWNYSQDTFPVAEGYPSGPYAHEQ